MTQLEQLSLGLITLLQIYSHRLDHKPDSQSGSELSTNLLQVCFTYFNSSGLKQGQLHSKLLHKTGALQKTSCYANIYASDLTNKTLVCLLNNPCQTRQKIHPNTNQGSCTLGSDAETLYSVISQGTKPIHIVTSTKKIFIARHHNNRAHHLPFEETLEDSQFLCILGFNASSTYSIKSQITGPNHVALIIRDITMLGLIIIQSITTEYCTFPSMCTFSFSSQA